MVLNSQKAMNDLLDKRGYIYSDRPEFVGAGELMGLNRVRRSSSQSYGVISRGPFRRA